MDMDEAAGDSHVRQQRVDARLGRDARHQDHALSAPSASMPSARRLSRLVSTVCRIGSRLRRIEVGEAAAQKPGGTSAPPTSAAAATAPARRRAYARKDGPRGRNAARAGAISRHSARALALEALALPVAVDQVQLRQRRMAFQHRRRIGVDQRIDFARGACA
jgi:hypothetical protein